MYRHVHDPLRHSRHTREVFACCRESCYRGAADNVPLTMYLLGMPKLLQVIMRLALCRARLRANYCMVLPSVVWTLVLYVCRVIREGGIACLIGAGAPDLLALALVCRRMDALPHRSRVHRGKCHACRIKTSSAACNHGRHASAQAVAHSVAASIMLLCR